MKQGDCSINSSSITGYTLVDGEACEEPEPKTKRVSKLKQLTSKLLNYEFKFSLFSKHFNFTFNSMSKSSFVFLNCLLMIFFMSVQSVLMARMSNQMRNYQYFLGSLFFPLLITLLFIPILLYKIFITKTITKESIKSVPMWNFAAMGFINTIGSLCSIIPAGFVSGNVNLAVQQALIINTVISSYLFLSTRFNALHYGGVLIVIIGIALDIFPMILTSFTNNTNHSSPHRNEGAWALVIFLSTVLGAVSNVLMEKLLKKTAIDMYYFQGMLNLWVFLFGLTTFWITFVPLPHPFHYIQPSEFPQYVVNSFKCLVGINSQVGDNCVNIYILYSVYTFFYFGQLVTTLIVFKYGSSTLVVVISALRLVTSNICFMIPLIAGPLTSSSLSGIQIESLFVLVCGVIMYSVTKENRLENDPIKKFFTNLFNSGKDNVKTLFTDKCLVPVRNLWRNRKKDEESTELLGVY